MGGGGGGGVPAVQSGRQRQEHCPSPCNYSCPRQLLVPNTKSVLQAGLRVMQVLFHNAAGIHLACMLLGTLNLNLLLYLYIFV